MKVFYTIADLQPESGGPTRSLAALAEAVQAYFDVSAHQCFGQAEVVALEYGKGVSAPMLPKQPVRTTLVPCPNALARKLKWTPRFSKTLRAHLHGARIVRTPGVSGPSSCNVVASPSLIHDNGLWLPTNHATASAARASGVPFISSPRGMLTSWAFKYRGFKKRVAWHLYQRRDLQLAKVLHATSHAEADDLRTVGVRQPIAVIPNGVEMPNAEKLKPEIPKTESDLSPGSTSAFQISAFQRVSSVRTALFLSRIHPKKGLLDLVEAWNQAKPAGWQVIVAGGDELGHRAQVESALRKCGLSDIFKFVGEVANEEKWKLYQSADLFVLPTKSENFGIVIAEALAAGLPVITTKGTPWEELETEGCGWWVKPNPMAVAKALYQACRLSEQERRQMGSRGRKLVESHYTWPAAGAKMVAVYQWMLGLGARPECVLSDW